MRAFGIDFAGRSEWGAQHGTGAATTGAKPLVIFHHSYLPDIPAGATRMVEQAAMLSMEEFHTVDNGWNGIAYNWLVFQSGHIYEGRGWNRIGAHTEGRNSSSVGICFVVDGDKHELTQAAINSARKIIDAGVANKFISPTYDVRGHHDYAAKTCPGTLIYPKLSQLFGQQPVLRLGSRGEAVIGLQRLLRIAPADGIFGPKTEFAVMTFQKEHRIIADGIVGSNTWRALLGR